MTKLNPLHGAGKPATVLRAYSCLLVNQFVTPGFGSLMAGRILEGLLQLTVALIGFCLFIGWFAQNMHVLYSQMSDSPINAPPYPWLGKVALIIFAVAWIFSWITSISIVREAKRSESNKPPFLPLPPKKG